MALPARSMVRRVDTLRSVEAYGSVDYEPSKYGLLRHVGDEILRDTFNWGDRFDPPDINMTFAKLINDVCLAFMRGDLRQDISFFGLLDNS